MCASYFSTKMRFDFISFFFVNSQFSFDALSKHMELEFGPLFHLPMYVCVYI